VVLRGESGTGKELIASAIVQSSDRANQPYICLNCSALPESLIESELFGYEKGAFTGADSARAGLIESAQNGTLFLDEITTLNPGLQSKLLRVLQERTVQRLGGRSSKKIDFRLICATNDDLEDLVKKGQFREDLYYRINVVPIILSSDSVGRVLPVHALNRSSGLSGQFSRPRKCTIFMDVMQELF
jgi:transcriptional regulator with PAS, ATPase and Fis domain